jgi:hypothetical protein
MAFRLPIAALACAAVLAGCSEDSTSNPEDPSGETPASGTSSALVPANDVARVRTASQDITTDCKHATEADVHTLVEVYDQSPEAIYEPPNGQQARSMVTVLEQNRDELRSCGRDDLAAALDRALGSA